MLLVCKAERMFFAVICNKVLPGAIRGVMDIANVISSNTAPVTFFPEQFGLRMETSHSLF